MYTTAQSEQANPSLENGLALSAYEYVLQGGQRRKKKLRHFVEIQCDTVLQPMRLLSVAALPEAPRPANPLWLSRRPRPCEPITRAVAVRRANFVNSFALAWVKASPPPPSSAYCANMRAKYVYTCASAQRAGASCPCTPPRLCPASPSWRWRSRADGRASCSPSRTSSLPSSPGDVSSRVLCQARLASPNGRPALRLA